MSMKKLRALLFLIPAVLLIGLLSYSLVQALRIYIPLKREERAYDALRNSVRAATAAAPTEAVPVSAVQDNAPEAAPMPTEADPAAEEPDGTTAARVRPTPSPKPRRRTVDITLGPPFEYEPLLRQNPDFAGWMTIEDTVVDYPVMKSSEDDPEYYIHRDFYGKSSYSGCLFIGGGCDIDSDSYIIYGHNMNNDTMFGDLDEYADYDYAMAHPEIHFCTPRGDWVYRVYAAFQTRVYRDRDDVFKYYEKIGELGREEYDQTVESVRRMSMLSLPYAPTYPEQLLFLSTCSYHTQDGRFVVAAYRVQ